MRVIVISHESLCASYMRIRFFSPCAYRLEVRYCWVLSVRYTISCYITNYKFRVHYSHGFYNVSRYPPSHPRPHCAFPWLLDKLRWTKAIVTAVSHFLVQNRVRILRTGQHNPTKNFQEHPPGDLKPGSKFTCQQMSIHLLIIRCFNNLWSFQHHHFALRNRWKFYVCR